MCLLRFQSGPSNRRKFRALVGYRMAIPTLRGLSSRDFAKDYVSWVMLKDKTSDLSTAGLKVKAIATVL
jgi:hypothetical protein